MLVGKDLGRVVRPTSSEPQHSGLEWSLLVSWLEGFLVIVVPI